jgi:hypothetical protein
VEGRRGKELIKYIAPNNTGEEEMICKFLNSALLNILNNLELVDE